MTDAPVSPITSKRRCINRLSDKVLDFVSQVWSEDAQPTTLSFVFLKFIAVDCLRMNLHRGWTENRPPRHKNRRTLFRYSR